MGKKQSGCNGGTEKVVEVSAREFALKVATHCKCHGCTDRLRAAVRDLTLAPGVEAVDQSAAEATGEVRVLATADPERLRKALRKATGKKVDLVFPPSKERKKGEAEEARAADAAAVQALLADLQLHHQYGGQAAARHQYGGQGAAAAAWAASQQHQQQLLGLGGGWNGGAGAAGGYGAAYPWQPSSAASYYAGAPAAGAGWGAYGGYGYAPAAQAPAQVHGGGYYGTSTPAWHGQGY